MSEFSFDKTTNVWSSNKRGCGHCKSTRITCVVQMNKGSMILCDHCRTLHKGGCMPNFDKETTALFVNKITRSIQARRRKQTRPGSQQKRNRLQSSRSFKVRARTYGGKKNKHPLKIKNFTLNKPKIDARARENNRLLIRVKAEANEERDRDFVVESESESNSGKDEQVITLNAQQSQEFAHSSNICPTTTHPSQNFAEAGTSSNIRAFSVASATPIVEKPKARMNPRLARIIAQAEQVAQKLHSLKPDIGGVYRMDEFFVNFMRSTFDILVAEWHELA